MNAQFLTSIPKLKGRENYSTWAFAIENYLIIDGLTGCLDGTETDAKKIAQTKSKIILSIEPSIYSHIKEAKSAKDVWTKLKSLYADSGFSRRISLLRVLITTKLETSESMETYICQIIETAQKLTETGFEITDEWIGSLLLAGLPEKFAPMIMAIEHSGILISADSIKTKLMDIKVENCGTAFAGNTFKKNKFNDKFKKKGPRCFNCNNYGHIKDNCPALKKSNDHCSYKSKSKNVHAFSAVFLSGRFNKNEWYVDSGASTHLTLHREWLKSENPADIEEIVVADNTRLPVISSGNIEMQFKTNGKLLDVNVGGVLCVPSLTTNLLSVSKLIENGNTVKFDSTGCSIFGKNNVLLARAKLIDNMYKLMANTVNCLMTVNADALVWHRRLGHINYNSLNKLKNGIVDGINFTNVNNSYPVCEPCCEGKQCRLPFKRGSRAQAILELVHTDVCGPMENASIGGAKYFVTFIDDFSRKVYVYIIKSKSDVFEKFKIFKSLVENQTGKRIKAIRSDNGTEFFNEAFTNLFNKCGIIHQKTNPYTPEQNGLAERMNRTIVEKAKCMLADAKLAVKFWAEAVNTSVYLINRSISAGLVNKTPEEVWSGNKPNLSNLRIFGSEAMVLVPKQKRTKWNPKSKKLIFVGYSEGSKGFRFIDPTNFKLVESRDVKFIESIPNQNVFVPLTDSTCDQDSVGAESIDLTAEDEFESVSSDIDETLDDTNDPDYIPDNDITVINEEFQRKSSRIKTKHDSITYLCVDKDQSCEPETVKEAIASKYNKEWKEAMQSEYQSLMQNKTWQLVNLPDHAKAIKCKWVFKIKSGDDGKINRFKARLVAKGCCQKQGIDYQETYSPVVRYSSIRYLMAIAAQFHLTIYQMDAVTAFLQGDLKEEVYMEQPEVYNDGTNRVCMLRKSMYGLKQASRQWNIKLSNVLIKAGFKQSKVDSCIYFNIIDKSMTFVAVYVDDLMIFSNDNAVTSNLKHQLTRQFEMKDLGEAQSCIGLRIDRCKQTGSIFLSQEKYIKNILVKFGMNDCKPVATPVDVNQKLTKEMSPKNHAERLEMEKIPYQEAVGSLLYLAQGTRPDITFAVNSVSRFNNDPGKAHWTAVKRIFRYLKNTSDVKIKFNGQTSSALIGYSDADWANDTDDRRSCTGYIFTRNGGPISWNSRRQHTVALSSTEAEYMALSSATQEAIWLKQFEEQFWPNKKPIHIHCDNRSAIHLAETETYHPRSKHIDVRHHFIRENVGNQTIILKSVGTEEMSADVLTKGVTGEKHKNCAIMMGMNFK